MKKTPSWFKRRTYLHFDMPVSYKNIVDLVSNPQNVIKWQFFPLLRVILTADRFKKNNGKLQKVPKERCIRYACHADSHLYSYYSYLIAKKYEYLINKLNLNSSILAFRAIKGSNGKGKCNIHFANKVFEDIVKRKKCCVLCYDVKSFFDNLNHAYLKVQLKKVLDVKDLPLDYYSIFKSITKYADVDRKSIFDMFGITKNSKKNGTHRICTSEEFRRCVVYHDSFVLNKTKKGIPQGTPISGLLSNVYMLDFDMEIFELSKKYNAIYYRYCDDIIIICDHSSKLFFTNILYSNINKIKLEIAKNKTSISTFQTINGKLFCDKPLQYLGFLYDGQHVSIRSSSYARYLKKMKKGVSLAYQTARKYNKIRANTGYLKQFIYEKKIYRRYSYLGNKNFISYALRASNIMNRQSIRKQVKPLWKTLNKRLHKANSKL